MSEPLPLLSRQTILECQSCHFVGTPLNVPSPTATRLQAGTAPASKVGQPVQHPQATETQPQAAHSPPKPKPPQKLPDGSDIFTKYDAARGAIFDNARAERNKVQSQGGPVPIDDQGWLRLEESIRGRRGNNGEQGGGEQ
ncbi:hypothetical protein LTR17_026772 [Elasticomyces elasticus]|nr:hypothetical protein LTR17_026772 [Elasticomyces elasticus]